MKVIYGKEKHFLVEVKSDGAGELEEHHLPGHQDYVEEGKMTQQHQHSIDKKSKRTELGGRPTRPQLDSRPKKKITDVKCGSNSSDCEYDEINITIPEEIFNIIENKKKSGATNLGSDPRRYPTRSPTSAPSSTQLGKKGGSGQRDIQYANPEHLVGMIERIIERKPVKDSGKTGSNGLREIQQPKHKDLKDYGFKLPVRHQMMQDGFELLFLDKCRILALWVVYTN